MSDSDSSERSIYIKPIKKIVKCGICNKKIKNYCKCSNNITNKPHSHGTGTNNIITILTNPEKDIKMDKGEKGDKGDKGLTGSMGIPGKTIILLSSNGPINNNDYIGNNIVSSDILKTNVLIPFNCTLQVIGFSIIEPIDNQEYTATLYVNNKPTTTNVILTQCNKTKKIIKHVSYNINCLDYISIKINYPNDIILNNRICISLILN